VSTQTTHPIDHDQYGAYMEAMEAKAEAWSRQSGLPISEFLPLLTSPYESYADADRAAAQAEADYMQASEYPAHEW